MSYNLLKKNEIIRNYLSKTLFIKNQNLINNEINNLLDNKDINEYFKNNENLLFFKSLFNISMRYSAIEVLKLLNKYGIIFFNEIILKSALMSGNNNLFNNYLEKYKNEKTITENEYLKIIEFMLKKSKIESAIITMYIGIDSISKIKFEILMKKILMKKILMIVIQEKRSINLEQCLKIKNDSIKNISLSFLEKDIFKNRFNKLSMLLEESVLNEKYFKNEKYLNIISSKVITEILNNLSTIENTDKKVTDKIDLIKSYFKKYENKININEIKLKSLLYRIPLDYLSEIFDIEIINKLIMDSNFLEINSIFDKKIILEYEKYLLNKQMINF